MGQFVRGCGTEAEGKRYLADNQKLCSAHRRTRRTNLGTKNLGTSIDIVDIDQNAWPDFVPIKSRFVLAQTANTLENDQGVVISKIVRDQIHGSFVIVVCQSQSWQTSITGPISTDL